MLNNKKADRAKQFLSFDSLKGFKDFIKAKQRIVVDKKELSLDVLEELDWQIKQIQRGQMIKLIYYDQNEYIELEGMITEVDLENKRIIKVVDKEINILDIIKIEDNNLFK